MATNTKCIGEIFVANERLYKLIVPCKLYFECIKSQYIELSI